MKPEPSVMPWPEDPREGKWRPKRVSLFRRRRKRLSLAEYNQAFLDVAGSVDRAIQLRAGTTHEKLWRGITLEPKEKYRPDSFKFGFETRKVSCL